MGRDTKAYVSMRRLATQRWSNLNKNLTAIRSFVTELKRVWRSQRFFWWMTQTLHRFPDENPFDHRCRLSDLDYITSSKAAMTSLAENYVGLPMDVTI